MLSKVYFLETVNQSWSRSVASSIDISTYYRMSVGGVKTLCHKTHEQQLAVQ